MRYQICVCLAALLLAPGHARAEASLLDFSRLAGVAQKHMRMLEDGHALTFWMTGVTEDAARLIYRSEMAGPCAIRVTAMFQDPPKWGHLTIYTYDFARASDFKAFATLDDQARQRPSLALTDPHARAGSLHGKGLVCVNFYDLGNDPAPYAYCDDRVDITWLEDPASKQEVVTSLASIAESCKLPHLKPVP